MRTNFILMSGAAALALLGVAGTTPVFAQYAGNPPQYSTPAEQAQTQQLNEQGMNGTDETPAELNGETRPQYNPQNYPSTNSPTYGTYGGSYSAPYTNNSGTPGYSGYPTAPGYPGYGNPNYTGYPSAPPQGYEQDQDQNDQDQPPQGQYGQGQYGQYQQYQAAPSQQQQQYDQQMQQYQNQQQEYQGQRDQYDRQRDRYEHNIRWYDQARWDYVYPTAFVYSFDAPRLMRVDMIAEPSQQLADVPIEGPNGRWVGRVRNVETGPDGRPARIEVALNRRVSVWVNPRRLRFDPRDRVVFTNLTREDLWNMPGATVESYPM